MLTCLDMYRLAVVCTVFWTLIAGDCQFPRTWQGNWFQSGLGRVVIHERTISVKGLCIDNQGDFFLVENREAMCFQCLLIMQRHRNIMQYKQSYCVGEDTLDEICKLIRVEEILFTLVRDPAIPVKCPFVDAYHFSYNNNTGGFCRSPTSYVQSCAADSKFLFQFKHCTDAAYTHRQDIELECIATWRDGSDNFMYARLDGPSILEREDTYRCLMYNVFGTVVHLAMSADPTCRGLISPTDGSLVIEFTKDTFGWPQPGCRFPHWFTVSPWQDLSGTHVYTGDPGGEVVTVTSYHHTSTSHKPHIRHAYRCIEPDVYNSTDDYFVAVSYTSHDCFTEIIRFRLHKNSTILHIRLYLWVGYSTRISGYETKYRCMRIVRLRDNMAEIHKGSIVMSASAKCQDIHFANSRKELLIPRQMAGKPCPFLGRYYLMPDSTGCVIDIRSGCNRTSQMDVVSSCLPKPVHIECLEVWDRYRETFMMARARLDNDVTIANCFVVRDDGDKITLRTDRKCNRDAPHIFEYPIEYTMDSKPDTCVELETRIIPPDDSPLTAHDRQSYGSGYKVAGNDDIIKDYSGDEPEATYYSIATHSTNTLSTLLLCLTLAATYLR